MTSNRFVEGDDPRVDTNREIRSYSRAMPDFSFFPAYIAAFFRSWFSEMSGFVGVVAFISALIAAARGKQLLFGPLITLAAVAVVIGGYDAWRSEYAKNIGISFFEFRVSDTNMIGDEDFNYSMNIENDTNHSLTLENVRLARIWMADTIPFQKITTNNLQCKMFVSVHPDAVKGMPNISQHWNVAGRPDVWYEFLHTSAIKMDDAPKSSFDTIFAPGAGHIFSISATGQKTDRSQFADVNLCPILTFSTYLERMTLICQGAAQGMIKDAAGTSRTEFTGSGINVPLTLPTKESPCRVLL
jgi:hypothetical protein